MARRWSACASGELAGAAGWAPGSGSSRATTRACSPRPSDPGLLPRPSDPGLLPRPSLGRGGGGGGGRRGGGLVGDRGRPRPPRRRPPARVGRLALLRPGGPPVLRPLVSGATALLTSGKSVQRLRRGRPGPWPFRGRLRWMGGHEAANVPFLATTLDNARGAASNSVVTIVLHPSILPAIDLALVISECQGGERARRPEAGGAARHRRGLRVH